MENQIIELDNASMLSKAQIDMQITTAKLYPRDEMASVKKAITIATFNREVAESCIYAKPVDGKIMNGPSIRLVEIMLNCWKNVHCSTMPISNDGKFIKVQAIIIDCENNQIYAEVKERSIMTSGKGGKTPRQYSFDMQQTTSAAAASIALRKAAERLFGPLLKHVVYEQVKKYLDNPNQAQLPSLKEKAISYFEKKGIERVKIFEYLEIASLDEMTGEHITNLIGIKNAVNEGDLKLEHAFDRNHTEEEGSIPNKADEMNQKLNHLEPPSLNE